jgi:hypothetical protein
VTPDLVRSVENALATFGSLRKRAKASDWREYLDGCIHAARRLIIQVQRAPQHSG